MPPGVYAALQTGAFPRPGPENPLELRYVTRKRIGLLAYFFVGSAIGLYLLYLLVREFGPLVGHDDIVRMLPAAVIVTAWFVIPLSAATQSWRLLFPPGSVPGPWHSARLTWIGLGVNWLLPVAMVGGELVKLRLALRRVADTENLVASLLGDKTIQVATQLLYTLLGLSVLAWMSEQVAGGWREAAGFLLFCGAVYLFYRLQRGGLFARAAAPLKRFARDRDRVAIKADRLDDAVDAMYRRRGRWWRAVGWRMAFRLLMAAEVAVILWWLGQPVVLWGVLALESVAQASRVAAVVIPAALGAQEAVIMAAGLLLGYPAEALFAVAVGKRVRELTVGGAGLIAWQLQETRALMRKDT